jgi:serine/threonine-protein kinase
MIGRTISHYRIVEKLGEGGMGVVYKAEDTKLKRTVALKFLPPELTRDPEAKARFIQEAQAASALDHPNICNIHEIDKTGEGQLFICMAYYEGETLKERIKRGRLETEEALSVAMQIGLGLDKAHAGGIVHRDIKPANIAITKDGVAKILDFGVAKLAGQARLTKTSSTLGTVAYMAPEQVRGEAMDHRADIWSLGVVLFEMLTGKLPFKGEYEQSLMYSILNETPMDAERISPGIPRELRRVFEKALAKKPEDRYRAIDEMNDALSSCGRMLGAAKGTIEPVRSKRRTRRLAAAGAACAIAAAAIILGRLYLFAPREKPIASIAVLPFQNISADPEQEYFSDGMTEALIAELSKIKALRVISRTSVMRFKKSEKSLPDIARQLNVDAVIEGSVQRVQDDVRVTAQLVRAAPEKHLWANTYTQSYRNILALESEIAQAIAREIRVTVTPEERERLAASRPVNPAAHEAYLKGRYYVHKWVQTDMEKGIEYLKQAVAIDSTYALAYAALAEAYDGGLASVPSREVARSVNRYAQKALSIDPTIAEAYVFLGDVKLTYDWDWEGAEANYRKALAMNPNSAVALGYYGSYLIVVGESDEALRMCIRAKELDPLDPGMGIMLANKYIYRRQYREAEEIIQEILSMDSTYVVLHALLGRIRFGEGRFDEAAAHYEKLLVYDEGLAEEGLAPALARAGRTAEARARLAGLIRKSEAGQQMQVAIAATYLALGEPDSGFMWLDRAYELRDANLPWIRLMPMFDDIRSDLRYFAIMKKLKLEP